MAYNITILGSTGSIGTQTLQVAENLTDCKITAITADKNIDLLESQIRRFKPEVAAMKDVKKACELKKRLSGMKTEVLAGENGIIEAASAGSANMVLNAIVGSTGLKPTIEAIKAGKNIALANKETLVTAGSLIMDAVKKHNTSILPVDSEHSAIFQCLQANQRNVINRIILTASGGPFRGKKMNELEKVRAKEALMHPVWFMGKKITIDCATLMNKGLEVIEAKWLFGVETDKIEVLVHPQSIIHSMVEFEDGAIMAQLGEPDMRVPIQYALTFPNRLKNNFPKIDFTKRNALSFEPPDTVNFPCLKLAYEAIQIGGTLPAVLNRANEIAVDLYLNDRIKFTDIPLLIEKALLSYNVKNISLVEDVLEAESWTDSFFKEMKYICQ